jgi:hypothetical protein
MLDKQTFSHILQGILDELSLRIDEGIVDLQNPKHLQKLGEIFDEMELYQVGDQLIENLMREDEDDDYTHLGAGIYVAKRDVDPDGGAKDGAQKYRKDGEGEQATFSAISDEEAEQIRQKQGDAGERAAASFNQQQSKDSGEGGGEGEEQKRGTTLDPSTSSGKNYTDQLPPEDPASTSKKKKDKSTTKKEKSGIEPVDDGDKKGDTVKTDIGKTLYSLGGGYYADNPGGTPKYIRTENTELINVNSILTEIEAKNQKGETITVQPISDKDIDKAVEKSKGVEFPNFSEQSEDDTVNYLIGTKTKLAQHTPTSTDEAVSQLDESREDAYAGRNAGKGGAATTAQEEVSSRLIELALQNPELTYDELMSKLVDEMEKMPYYAGKSRKQLETLAAKSSAGVKIAKHVKEKKDFDYNPNQPEGFPKSFAFTGKATETVANFLITKLKEAKESGDEEAIAHYENEIRKFAEHSTSATGKEGDGDTALMYIDNQGRIRIVHITNKQSYADPKSNATKKSKAKAILEHAVEGTDVEKLNTINDIASGDVIGMNQTATQDMQSLKNDATLKDDVENIPPNIVNALYGNKTFDPSGKYKKAALKNKLVREELKKMGKDPSTATDQEILQAVINTVGEEGASQISDSTTGAPGKLLMKMGNLWKDVNSKFESLKNKYPEKSDEEICEIISNVKEPKTGKPLYGGELSSDEICEIRNNKALKRLSEISDARGESMRTTHNNIVSETTEADIQYFMEKEGVSEAEAREMTETQNGPNTETVVRTFMDGMHWTRSIMGDADTEMLQSVGSSFVKSEHYRQCLASLTGYEGDLSTREGREGLVNHLAKNVRITPGDGSVQFVNSQTGKTVLLGEDTWRTAGDGEKIAGHDGKDLIECIDSKQNSE